MGTSSCARPARVVRETLVFDALDADGHPELPASGVLGHGRAVVSAPAIPIFCVGIVDLQRSGSVPLISSRGTGTDAASIISWAGACLDPGFPSTGNATTLVALSAGSSRSVRSRGMRHRACRGPPFPIGPGTGAWGSAA